MSNNKVAMPQSVARVKFIDGLKDLVKKSGLPAHILEPIFKDFYMDISNASKEQYKHDLEAYETLLKQQGINE